MMLSGTANFKSWAQRGFGARSSRFQHDLSSDLRRSICDSASVPFQRHHCVQVGFGAAACRHVEKSDDLPGPVRGRGGETAPRHRRCCNFDEREIQRNLGDCPSANPITSQRPFHAVERQGTVRDQRPLDQDNVAPTGQGFNCFANIIFAMDGDVGTVLLRDAHLSSLNRLHDMCAKGVADLNRSKTGTACRTGHQQRFPDEGLPVGRGHDRPCHGRKHGPA